MASIEYRASAGNYLPLQVGSAPIGSVVSFAGSVAPPGWHLCNGTAHGSTALQAVLGSANTPDLRDRFIVGVSASYAAGATGGVATVTLSAAQSGRSVHGHTAPASGAATGAHSHSGATTSTGTSHGHGAHYRADVRMNTNWNETKGGDIILKTSSGNNVRNAAYGAHIHGARNTDSSGLSHSHTVTVNNSTAVTPTVAHENMPPFYALTFIICKG